jgi:MraZ protein
LHFVGTFDYAMDERGRVPLPPVYRDAFREGIVLSQGHPDRCLRVYTRGAFDAQAVEVTADSLMLKQGRDLRRAFFASARNVELDKQNRILIPTPLRQWAGLDRQVLVVGTGECLEIWDPTRWKDESEQLLASLAATMESSIERRRT